jgi:uncharacterized protein (UPF0332 family)
MKHNITQNPFLSCSYSEHAIAKNYNNSYYKYCTRAYVQASKADYQTKLNKHRKENNLILHFQEMFLE